MGLAAFAAFLFLYLKKGGAVWILRLKVWSEAQNKIRKNELKMKIVEVGLHYCLIDEKEADQIVTELLQSIDNI